MLNLFNVFILAIMAFFQSLAPLPTYTEGVVGQPVSFNPLKVGTNQIDRDVSSLIFRGLVKYNLKGEIVADLAESWTISPDGREYTFILSPRLFWHDGRRVSADDIIYTVSQTPQLKGLSVDKMDNLTVRFRLKEPLASFLDILTIGVIPAHLASALSDLNPIGNGAFRVLRVKKSDKVDQIILQSRQQRLIFSFYNSGEELMTAARTGEVDGFIAEGETNQVRWRNFNYYQVPVLNRYYALFFNLGNELLKDSELRRSLALSTPKERIAKEVFRETVTVVDGPLDGTFAESNTYRKYLYDNKLDKNYNLSLTLTIPNKEEHRETARLIKESWGRIGVHLNVREVAADKLLPEVIGPKKFEVLLLGQEVARDPDRYTLWHSTQKDLPGLNFTTLKQIRVDRSLEEGRQALPLEDRLTSYEHFQTVIAEEVPAVFLYRPVVTYALKKKIRPTGLDAVFFLKDRFADFASWEFK